MTAANQGDELATFHSITSSARASSVGGTSSLSALAVLRLSTVSYSVGACTGRAAGFSPMRMPIAGRAPVGLNRIRPVIRPPGLHPSPNVAGPDGLQPWLAYWFLGRSLGQAFRVA
jgi:hypothetical protein